AAGTSLRVSNDDEETSNKLSEETSFFSIRIDNNKSMIDQFVFANSLPLEKKFVPLRIIHSDRRIREFESFELAIKWRIIFPSTNLYVEESRQFQTLSTSEDIEEYTYGIGFTTPQGSMIPRFEDLSFQAQRSRNDAAHVKLLPVAHPQGQQKTDVNGETYTL